MMFSHVVNLRPTWLGPLSSCQRFAQDFGRKPGTKVSARVFEANRSAAINNISRWVGHALLDCLLKFGLPDAIAVDNLVVGIEQKHERFELVISNKALSLCVDLRLAHDIDHHQARVPLEHLMQLNEPRLGVGSPIEGTIKSQ